LLEQIFWSYGSRMGRAITKESPAKSNPVSHTGAFYLSFSKNPPLHQNRSSAHGGVVRSYT
jgi:hypothetical protein